MSEQREFDDLIMKMDREGSTDGVDLVRLKTLFDRLHPAAPAPDTIEITVTWHRGGASGAKWPWGEAAISPGDVRFQYSIGNTVSQRIWRSEWDRVVCYCDPADLQPPTFEERRDV